MMRFQIVTTAEHEETRASEAEAGLKHGTVVLDRLVKPWYGRGNRIVCADSYFGERGGRAAPPGPRSPVHRRCHNRHVKLSDEAAAVQGVSDLWGMEELGAPTRRQGCGHGSGVGRPRAKVLYLYRV
jgi:hypothetical protein